MFVQNDNQKQISILHKLINIYSKYLLEKKRKYFFKFHLIASKKPPNLCICNYNYMHPTLKDEYDSISLNRGSFQRHKSNNNITENNINYNKDKFIFSKHASCTNINKPRFSYNNKIPNKSVYSNYINLNKSQYYYNGNEIKNISHFKINNYNNSMFINNSSTDGLNDQNYVVKIKLSNNCSFPNLYKSKIFYNNLNNNSINGNSSNIYNNSITENTNNIFNNTFNNINNNKKIIVGNDRYKHYSYKNTTIIPNRINSTKNLIRNSYYNSYKSYQNSNKEIIKRKIYDFNNTNILKKSKENNFNNFNNSNNKIVDQQIIDYLNRNNNEKRNLIQKMKSQKIIYHRINTNSNINNDDKVIKFKNLNNYSYINNNFNYYCSGQNSPLRNSNNKKYKNINYTLNNNNKINIKKNNLYNLDNLNNYENYEILNYEKYPIQNTIYSNYLKKRVKKTDNIKYPVSINYTNENINTENILPTEPIIKNNNEKIKKIPLHLNRKSKNKMKIDYFKPKFNSKINEKSPERLKIPTPLTKIFPSKFNTKIIRNTVDNIKYKKSNNNFNNNISYEHFDTDRTLSSKNNSLYGCQSLKSINKKKLSKNKINKNIIYKKINNNIIQKSLNLFFRNENKGENNEKLFSSNEKIDIIENNKNNDIKEKKIKISKIPNGINHKKNNSQNPNNINKRKINNSKKLIVSHNVINEQFNKDKIDKKEPNINEKESDSLRYSVQSMNDSKIMEMAKNFIEDEELNRDEIKEILNCKKENKE